MKLFLAIGIIEVVSIFFLIFFSCYGEEEPPSYSLWDYHPLHIGGNALRIGKASLDSNENGHLYFRKNNAFLTMLVPINRHSYFFPRIEWNNFTIAWNQNPKFNETHFYYAQFGLMFFTTALEEWRWILRAEYSMDLEHFARPSEYGQFSGLIWGSYELHKKWRYHVGGTGSVGLKGSIFYPLLGLSFSPNKYWSFEAIFPILYSIQYKLNKNWHFAIKGRPLKERFRTGSHEPQPRSIFNYSSLGTECNIHFELPMHLEVEAYAGYNFGGNFYIKNQMGRSPLYTDLGGAPYGGVSIDYGF